ncbi:MAG: type I methionyl aminopeptidase [Planctomycetaceae bacterium]|nr:type I methionyl aminopeptidase [Planctomycetaceae bacterium]
MGRQPPIYNAEERDFLRAASGFNAELMDFIRPHAKPGARTIDLDKKLEEYTLDHGHTPACLGYAGPPGAPPYPNVSCISVNEVVCHGIPNEYELKDGDIVNIDLTTIVSGWHGDQSGTFIIGEVSDETKRLVQTTFESLWVGIRAIEPYGKVRDIGAAIYKYATEREFEVVRDYQGHGIGRSFHQEPGVPHFWFRGSKAGSQIVRPGMCFTIEPMLNLGTWKTVLDKFDGWTVRTLDGKLTAQFEHTILMTDDGPEIMTLTKDGPQEGHQF